MEQKQYFMEQKSQLVRFWKDNFSFNEQELRAFEAVKREDFIPASLKPNVNSEVPATAISIMPSP